MKKILKTWLITILAAVCSACLFVGCADKSGDESKDEPKEQAILTIEAIDTTLEIYESVQLNATLTGSTATVTWESSNTSVAEVAQNGLVTALAEGSATISAKAGDLVSSCVITVTDNGVVPVLSLKDETVTLLLGDMFTLSAYVEYSGKVFDGAVEYAWSVEESDKVEVCETNGSKAKILAKELGTANVMVKATVVGKTLTNIVSVSITANNVELSWGDKIERKDNEYVFQELYGVAIDDKTNTYELGKELFVYVDDQQVETYEAQWSVVDDSILEIDEQSGEILAKKAGETTVVATVYEQVISVQVVVNYLTVELDKIYDLSAFDYEAYKKDNTVFGFNQAAEVAFISEYDGVLTSVFIGEKEAFSGSIAITANENISVALDYTKIFSNNAVTNFGETTIAFNTESVRFVYPANVYTMILTEVEHVQNWLNISAGLGAKTNYSNGYFVLGNNIVSESSWNYVSNYSATGHIFDNTNYSKGFGGVFDGRGYYIDNMNIVTHSEGNEKGQAFVPVLTGTIKNVAFTNSTFTVSRGTWSGFVTAFNSGTITDVYADVEVINVNETKQTAYFGVFGAMSNSTNKVKVERCISQVAFDETKFNPPSVTYLAYITGGVLKLDNFKSTNTTTTIEDIYTIGNAWITERKEPTAEQCKATHRGGFETATAMAAATANAYETNFVTNVENSVWTVDNQGLPYFKSMSATPYVYA